MIEIIDLSLSIKGFTLRNISLTIETGTCHVLIGPTGCGKTTLLEAVLGLREIQKGKILLEGKDITKLPVHKRGFSYVPQDLAIFPHLTVEENLFYGIKHSNISNKEQRYREVLNLAERLGISYLLKRKAVNLSGGERQRIALARALAPGCKYLLLDEPLSALHEGMKRELWFLLKEMQINYDLTIFMVTHDLKEAFFLADNVSVMIDGAIIQTGKKEEVYTNPLTLEVARFFGIKNIFEAEIIELVENYYKTYCEILGAEIWVPMEKFKNINEKKQRGDKLLFGIRSEDVIILRPDLPMRKENLLKGIIKEVYLAGSNSIVLFQPERSKEVVEIIMPEYAFSKLAVRPTIPATITLRPERIFLLSDAKPRKDLT
ncbi:MAG: ABC transporter ATP-binding protein [Caldimicrobium sp.]